MQYITKHPPMFIPNASELQSPAQDLVASALEDPAYDIQISSRFFGPLNFRDFHSLTRGRLDMDDVIPFHGEKAEQVHISPHRLFGDT